MSAALACADASTAELRAMVDRFATLAFDWRLADAEVEALLATEVGSWPALRGFAAVPDVEAETRMRRSIEVAGILRCAVGDDAACREWLRAPHAGIVGRRRPLDVMCDRGVGLRALRDRLRDETMQARVGRC